MATATESTAYKAFREALNVSTQGLTRDERSAAVRRSRIFTKRLEIELAADMNGWDIPPYGSDAWLEMQAEFSESYPG